MYSNRGNAKYALSRAKEAIADYDKAIELNPKDALAYNNRGIIKRALDDYEGAPSRLRQGDRNRSRGC